MEKILYGLGLRQKTPNQYDAFPFQQNPTYNIRQYSKLFFIIRPELEIIHYSFYHNYGANKKKLFYSFTSDFCSTHIFTEVKGCISFPADYTMTINEAFLFYHNTWEKKKQKKYTLFLLPKIPVQ